MLWWDLLYIYIYMILNSDSGFILTYVSSHHCWMSVLALLDQAKETRRRTAKRISKLWNSFVVVARLRVVFVG